LTLPTGTPEIRTSASCASWPPRRTTLEAVALRLERDRAAERQPQEQQQAEARQREHDHRGDAAEGGSGLASAAPPGPARLRADCSAGALSSCDERAELRVGRDRV
jgi:hypothetical protein